MKPRGFDAAWRSLLEAWRESLLREQVVGAGLMFAHRGRVIEDAWWGFADRDPGRRADAQTVFNWASMSKMLTGVAVLQARDGGWLRLDDRVVDHLPSLGAIAGPIDRVTVRMLLNHSSGLRGPAWKGSGPPQWSQVEALLPEAQFATPPGARYAYSNFGFAILGQLVARVGDGDFEVHVENRILRPLGMASSFYNRTPPFLRRRRSNNYHVEADGSLAPGGLELDTGGFLASGGYNGDLEDMMRFANFLLGVGDKARHQVVLARDSVSEMMTPTLVTEDSAPGLKEQMGLALFLQDDVVNDPANPVRYVGHTGSQDGFRGFVFFDPVSTACAIGIWNTRIRGSNQDTIIDLRWRLFDNVFPLLSGRGK